MNVTITDQTDKVLSIWVGVDTLRMEETETDDTLKGGGHHASPRTIQVTQFLQRLHTETDTITCSQIVIATIRYSICKKD